MLRYFASILLNPVLVFWLLLAGAIFCHLFNQDRWFKAFAWASIIWLALTSTPFLPQAFTSFLERQYPSFSAQTHSARLQQDSIHIMVLAAGYSPDPHLNAAVGQLAPTSLARLSEGIRIHRLFPHSQIVCSAGPARGDRQSQAAVTARAARELGVAPENLLLAPTPTNTREEAIAYRDLYGGKKRRLILVTSAIHMPRAMMHFRKAGLDPIPAPADFKITRNPYHKSRDFWPAASNMVLLESNRPSNYPPSFFQLKGNRFRT